MEWIVELFVVNCVPSTYHLTYTSAFLERTSNIEMEQKSAFLEKVAVKKEKSSMGHEKSPSSREKSTTRKVRRTVKSCRRTGKSQVVEEKLFYGTNSHRYLMVIIRAAARFHLTGSIHTTGSTCRTGASFYTTHIGTKK